MRSPNIVARRIGGEVILVPIRSNASDLQSVYSLDEVGAFVWERIDGQRTFAGLVDAICDEYGLSRAEAERDLDGLVGHLEKIGALARF